MKAYIQCNSRMLPFNETAYNAYLGFDEMGVETVLFNSRDAFKGAGRDRTHPEHAYRSSLRAAGGSSGRL